MTDILDTLNELDDEELESSEEEKDDALKGNVFDSASLERQDGEFSASRAREITETIKAAATATYGLMYEAYSHKAHKALGYSSWEKYVREEFEMSKSRSYQLIAQAEAINSIQEVAPEGTDIKLTEAQVRDLKSELPRITEIIAQETSEMTPEEADDFIDELIAREREQIQAEQKALEAKKAAEAQAQQEGYQNALEDVADSMLEEADGGNRNAYNDNGIVMEPDEANSFKDNADSGLFEYDVEGNSGAVSSEDALNLYNFYSMLSMGTSLPEPDYIIDLISQDRYDEVENQIAEFTSWVNRFYTIWEERN